MLLQRLAQMAHIQTAFRLSLIISSQSDVRVRACDLQSLTLNPRPSGTLVPFLV